MSDHAAPFKVRTMKRKNVKGLALSAAATKPPARPEQSLADAGAMDTLEIGVEFKLDLKSEDLILIKELGAGNGGTVSKVKHASTGVVMARKIIRVEAKEKVRKQILRELQIGHECKSPYIVTFYGAFPNESHDIVLCMEYMDVGSLEWILKEFGPVRVDVLGKISESILQGLCYLYEEHRIMHRDIKPSNVLVNSRGQIKLCDFGVSAEIINSVAETFVGTSTFMAPERIQGAKYTIKSDVWSFGLTIFTLACAKFPFETDDSDERAQGPMGILDLLQRIVHEPSPRLPDCDAFPQILYDMVDHCLLKNPDVRPSPRELLNNGMFIKAARRTPVDLQAWAVSMIEKNHRKSHLAPPPPTSLKAGNTSPASSSAGSANTNRLDRTVTPSTSSNWQPMETPTSGEIPIARDNTRENMRMTSPSVHHHYNGGIGNPLSANSVPGSGIQQRPDMRPNPPDRPRFPPRISSNNIIKDQQGRDGMPYPHSSHGPHQPPPYPPYPSSKVSLPLRPAPSPSSASSSHGMPPPMSRDPNLLRNGLRTMSDGMH